MNLLIVDDCPAMCAMLRKIATEDCGFTHVEIAHSAAVACRVFDEQPIEALVLDIGLPDRDGFTVAEHALARRPATRVFMFSGHLNEYTVSRTTQLRLHGFVDKCAEMDEIAAAFRALREGTTYYSADFLEEKAHWHANPYAFDKRLTATEQRVASLIALGCCDDEIAADVGITRRTAGTHRGNILRKLDLPGTPKLIVGAIARGFGTLH